MHSVDTVIMAVTNLTGGFMAQISDRLYGVCVDQILLTLYVKHSGRAIDVHVTLINAAEFDFLTGNRNRINARV